MKRIIFLFNFILLISLQISIAQKSQPKKAYDKMLDKMYKQTVPLVQPGDLKEDELDQYLILDTREWQEYNVSHIKGAQWAGYNNFQSYILNNVPKDKPILVYCSVGYRSERIGEKLKEMGFKDIKNLYGGIFEWVNQDGEIVDASGNNTQQVHAFDKEWGKWLRKGEKVY